MAKDLRAIYAAATLAEAQTALERFAERWDERYPAISPSWRADWQRLTVFFDHPSEIRRVIYTTNAIESLNYSLRRVLKTRGAFPNDDALTKVLYLALRNVAKKWTRPIQNWRQSLNQFVILFPETCLVGVLVRVLFPETCLVGVLVRVCSCSCSPCGSWMSRW